MPAVNVRRRGMGNPERSAKRKDTQVENLRYGGVGCRLTRDAAGRRRRRSATRAAPSPLPLAPRGGRRSHGWSKARR